MSIAKIGRGRAYPEFGGIEHELDYLAELRQRADDLINDLDDETKSKEQDGHSIKQLFDHMISAEVSWFSKLRPQQTSIIPKTTDYLDQFTRSACTDKQINDFIDIGPFKQLAHMIRHLQWHWTYHSAQIGMLRRMLDKPYNWKFA